MCYFAYLSFEPEHVEFFSFKLQLVSNQSKKRNFFIFLISLFTFISFILLKKSYCMFVVAMEFYLNNFSNFYCSNLIDFPFMRNQTIQSDKEDSLRKDL